MSKNEEYYKCLDELEKIGEFVIKPGLERIEAIMENLGNPEKKLKTIIVGGTNGKGTTCHKLEDLIKNKDKRSGSFELELNYSIDDAHIILQEPLIAEDFIFPEKDIESFKDQHGINFKRIHLNNYKANTNKTISFNYSNPSGDISINKLQTILSDNGQSPLPPTESTSSSSIVPPLRHKLPSWQPLLVLSVVAVVVGWMYSHQSKDEKAIPLKVSKQKKGKFCTQCGSPVNLKDKFCSNCGGKL